MIISNYTKPLSNNNTQHYYFKDWDSYLAIGGNYENPTFVICVKFHLYLLIFDC